MLNNLTKIWTFLIGQHLKDIKNEFDKEVMYRGIIVWNEKKNTERVCNKSLTRWLKQKTRVAHRGDMVTFVKGQDSVV